MKSQTSKRIKSTSQATLHTNPGGDNRWRPEVRFFAKTAKRIKSTSPGKTKKPKNESSLQARAPPPKPKRAPGSIRERSERVRYMYSTVPVSYQEYCTSIPYPGAPNKRTGSLVEKQTKERESVCGQTRRKFHAGVSVEKWGSELQPSFKFGLGKKC